MNKNETKMIQGLSVLAMVCLHLFCRESGAGLYATPVMLFGLPVSFYFAQISDFCVFGFALCSGYAHWALYGRQHYYRRRLVSLLALYGRFWLIVLLFTVTAAAIGQGASITGDPLGYFLSCIGVLSFYNGAWWYISVYAVLVFLSPLLMKLSRKSPLPLVVLLMAVCYLGGYVLRFRRPLGGSVYIRELPIGAFFMTLAEYLFGALLHRFGYFEKAKAAAQKIHPALFWCGSAVVIAAMMFLRAQYFRTLFIAPLTGMAIFTVLVAGKKPRLISDLLLFFGRHSTNIWLTHMFFFHTLFVNFAFIAKYPPLIYLFELALCIALSYAINLIYRPIQTRIERLNR